MKNKVTGIVSLALIALASSPALAHPGHLGHGTASGLAHPFSGDDHILAMVAVGFWAAQLGGRAVWLVPLAFVCAMVFGAGLGLGGLDLPLVESGIAASVVVLGLMVSLAFRVPAVVAASGVGLFAMLHGHAHGTELPGGAEWVTYCMGFALGTATLHLTGIGLALLFKRWASERLTQYAGGAIAACGGLLLAGF